MDITPLLISPWVRVRGCFGAPRDIRTCGVENVNFEQSHTNVDCVSTKPSLKQPHRRSKPRPEKNLYFPDVCMARSLLSFVILQNPCCARLQILFRPNNGKSVVT